MSGSVASSMPTTFRPSGTRGRIRRGMASPRKPISGDGARHAGRHTSPYEVRKNHHSPGIDTERQRQTGAAHSAGERAHPGAVHRPPTRPDPRRHRGGDRAECALVLGPPRTALPGRCDRTGALAEMVCDLMIACCKRRFGATKVSHSFEWLSDKGSAYIAKETAQTAAALGLRLPFTSVRCPRTTASWRRL